MTLFPFSISVPVSRRISFNVQGLDVSAFIGFEIIDMYTERGSCVKYQWYELNVRSYIHLHINNL